MDADLVLRDGMSLIRDLPRLLSAGTMEERKEFVRAFVAGVTVVPDENRLNLQVRRIPALSSRDSTCLMVAGARCERVQIGLEPLKGYLAGIRRCAA